MPTGQTRRWTEDDFDLVDRSKGDTDAICAISRVFVTISGFAKLLPVGNKSHQIDL